MAEQNTARNRNSHQPRKETLGIQENPSTAGKRAEDDEAKGETGRTSAEAV